VSAKKARRVELLLTDRALSDLRDIERYSIETWGRKTADKYLADIESAFQRVSENPTLLREQEDLPAALRFYRVNKHWMACDVRHGAIIVLTVIHGSMDLPHRLAELQPTLPSEAELLQAQLPRRKRPRS
jgi:plasmid stabilization system protein ParE